MKELAWIILDQTFFTQGKVSNYKWLEFFAIMQALHHLNPSCTKVFGTHTFYEEGGGGGGGRVSRPPSMISKTVDSTNFKFGRPLGLSMRGRKLVELMI